MFNSTEIKDINYTYEKGDVFTQTSRGLQKLDNKKSIYRSDTGDVLSVMGNNYHPVQPAEMRDFYQRMADKYDMKLTCFTDLDNGKKLVGIADTGTEHSFFGDLHKNFLVFYTALDGTSATKVMPASVRMACTNQLKAMSRDATDSGFMHYLRHTSQFSSLDCELDLGLIDNTYADFYKDIERIANTPFGFEETSQFFLDLLGLDEVPERKGLYQDLMMYTKTSPGAELDSANNTLYGTLNAVSYYTDHMARTRKASNSLLARANSSMFTGGARLKQKAYNLALAIAA